MLHKLLSGIPSKVDVPKLGEYKTYTELKAEFDKYKYPNYQSNLLSDISRPTFDSFQCHLYNASYVTLWMHENKRIAVKPLPARSRDVNFPIKENDAKETKEIKETKESIYKLIPKEETAKETPTKKGSVLSMRYIARKLGSPVGNIPNGDKLCEIINAFRTFDPEQRYTAKNIKPATQTDYINTIIAAIDNNTPPIVSYDFVPQTETAERKGEREHSSIVAGYIQTTGAAPQTLFAILGSKGYWLVTAEQLYNSTNQLEAGRIYSKEKSDFSLENEGRKDITDEVRALHGELMDKFKDCDAVKVKNVDRTAWWPVPKLANFVSKGWVSLPAIDKRNVPDNPDCWRNNIVIIQPDESTSSLTL